MQTKIVPFLWFNDNAEEAMKFYVSVFPNSRVGAVTRYPEGAPAPAGSVMTAECELDGQKFILLNGGPHFKFTEAVSFLIYCDDQKEVDYYWDKLISGGGEPSQCGWLKDKFGLSWQVTPRMLMEANADEDRAKASRVMKAMLTMTKIDIAELEHAAAGETVATR
jgi:predicted 3-demethylubiquinone-9 3-methyltransferase (glyoxalase superfamily)